MIDPEADPDVRNDPVLTEPKREDDPAEDHEAPEEP